jgi:hypothetical protein
MVAPFGAPDLIGARHLFGHIPFIVHTRPDIAHMRGDPLDNNPLHNNPLHNDLTHLSSGDFHA